jgi:hypothetical protein
MSLKKFLLRMGVTIVLSLILGFVVSDLVPIVSDFFNIPGITFWPSILIGGIIGYLNSNESYEKPIQVFVGVFVGLAAWALSL